MALTNAEKQKRFRERRDELARIGAKVKAEEGMRRLALKGDPKLDTTILIEKLRNDEQMRNDIVDSLNVEDIIFWWLNQSEEIRERLIANIADDIKDDWLYEPEEVPA